MRYAKRATRAQPGETRWIPSEQTYFRRRVLQLIIWRDLRVGLSVRSVLPVCSTRMLAPCGTLCKGLFGVVCFLLTL